MRQSKKVVCHRRHDAALAQVDDGRAEDADAIMTRFATCKSNTADSAGMRRAHTWSLSAASRRRSREVSVAGSVHSDAPADTNSNRQESMMHYGSRALRSHL